MDKNAVFDCPLVPIVPLFRKVFYKELILYVQRYFTGQTGQRDKSGTIKVLIYLLYLNIYLKNRYI